MDDAPHQTWTAPDGSARSAASDGPDGAARDPLAVFVPPGSRARKPWSRRQKLLVTAIPLGTVLLVGIAVAGWFGWSLTRYTVVERDGAVLLEHGSGPVRQAERTDLDVHLLPIDRRRALADGIPAGDRAAADAWLAELRTTAENCRANPLPPCPMGTLKAAVLKVESLYPHPTRMKISWRDLDRRPGVRVILQLNGAQPPAPCPEVLERPGNCVFDGELETEYRATAFTVGPDGAMVESEAFAITDYAPFIDVHRGNPYRIKDDRGRLSVVCDVVVEVRGLEYEHTYRATVLRSDRAPTEVSFTTGLDGTFGYGNGDPIAIYPDAGRGAWVQVKIKGTGLVSKRLPWRCRD